MNLPFRGLLLLLITTSVLADGSDRLSKLKQSIESVIPASAQKNLNYGILAVSLDNGDILYEKNSETKLVPASTCKVFTSYVALKKLKPTSTFKTWVYAVGPTKDGKLQGDLYLKGGGDPSFVSERLWMLINDLRRSGIRQVAGNIVVDASYFDEETRPESRPKYLKDQAYNAPVGALSFNFNTTTVFVRPADKPGVTPIVYTDPENAYIEIVNQAKTGKAGSTNDLRVNRTDYVKGDVGDVVLLRGSIPTDAKEMRFYRNIVNPSLYAGHMVKSFMQQRGMTVEGNVTEGKVPEGAKQLVEFESLPLWQVVWGMNKFSNNFVADQLLKKVGAEVWGAPGTLQKGISALEDSLEDIGIPRKSYVIQDGSGLTRQTRVTPNHLVTVLKSAWKDFSISSEFSSSFGIAGEDGTLRNRFPSSTRGFIRAKTGTLDGVTALAGYLQTVDGEMVAFAILLNDPKNKYGRMTGWTDQITTLLTRFSRKG